jgi:hypothetical protein
VACKQVQNFRPPRSFDFQLRLKINLRKQEKSFQRSDQCINSGTNLFELLWFLLSTNAKVKKMTTVSAVMFEIVEMYIFQIHLHYFFLADIWWNYKIKTNLWYNTKQTILYFDTFS